MQRREFLSLTAAAMAGAAVAPRLEAAGTTKKRPNVILIMADDLGYECLGCNGSEQYHTPHLDALAKAGLRFTQCYSQPS